MTPVNMADIVDDALWVARARAGDSDAFAQLYRAHHRRVFALCLRLAADASLAEDLTQEAFVKAWRSLGGFRGEAKFSTWLYRLTANTVISYQRRDGWWRALRSSEAPDEAVAPGSTAEALDLAAAIARLPLRARQVFVLIDIEGFSHEEASQALGMAVGTSKAQLFRARGLLRGMLGDGGEGDDIDGGRAHDD